MTPKQKAIEIFDKIYLIKDSNDICSMREDNTKKCALICVDEVLKLINDRVQEWSGWEEEKQFWEDVKIELSNFIYDY